MVTQVRISDKKRLNRMIGCLVTLKDDFSITLPGTWFYIKNLDDFNEP
jgi:hypothetical protein